MVTALNPDVHTHYIIVGDRQLPIGVICERADGTVVDLTGKTVKFSMITDAGTAKVDNVAATLNDATAGKVQYSWAAADVDTAGVFWGYFHTLDASSLVETFPPDGRKLRIVITARGKVAGT